MNKIDRQKKGRNLLGPAIVLAGSAALAATFGPRIFAALQENPPAATAASTPDTDGGEVEPRHQDWEQYTPPAEGTIVKSRFDPRFKKTILYFPDAHPVSGAAEMLNIHAKKVQRELLKLVLDLIQKVGRVPVVLESWPVGAGVEALKETPPEAAAEDEDFRRIYEIARNPDAKERKRIVDKIVGTTLTPVGMALMTAYQDECIPLGSETSYDDTTDSLELVNEMQRLQDMSTHPDDFECIANHPLKKPLTLGAAMRAFRTKRRSLEAVSCYCLFREMMNDAGERLIRTRYMEAAQKETAAALRYPGQFVVVIAGTNHVAVTLQILEDQPVNYLVIEPRSLGIPREQYLKDPQRPPLLPDDAQGTCERVAEVQRQRTLDALGKWLDSED